jgi:hypothetical protein
MFTAATPADGDLRSNVNLELALAARECLQHESRLNWHCSLPSSTTALESFDGVQEDGKASSRLGRRISEITISNGRR